MMAEYAIGATLTAVFHPVGFSRFLIQLGHEPLHPETGRAFLGFGKDKTYYPNILRYMGHIRQKEGFLGLYRGLVPRILGGFVGNFTTTATNNYLKGVGISEDETEKAVGNSSDELVGWLKTFFLQTSKETVGRCVGIIVSQPFHVIMLRCQAQFIGGETVYNSLWSSMVEIYNNDGVLGFFGGLIPRLVGEVITIFLTNFLANMINKHFLEDKEMRTYTSSACGLVIGTFTYRFSLVGNLMAVNNTGLVAAKYPYMLAYSNWYECWGHLSKERMLGRGSRLFNRIFTPRHYVALD
ncbi:mitochondrial carrier homolog 2-like [Mizuhopecten yessoensis]|uniref:Mitochondrial carrier-like 2 n=1 Tax=Mizuhopecten yessoensis TaxID=6573 RepID=A0A210QUP9_MIZYE|nr:mitochondrial carrier homolog 2-like [Mizuhopecten yessoensis]OWF52493.1 Mitochondrial carrier-like 2 [Mizuhopecten yessoensis]